MEENQKYLQKMKYIKKTHNLLRQEKLKKIVEERKKYEGMDQFNLNGDKRVFKGVAIKDQAIIGSDQSPFSYLQEQAKKGKKGEEAKNLKVTLDIITKMNFKDFNQVGEKD